MTRAFAAVAHGAPSSELIAYDWQAPVSHWLGGYRHHVPHWDWQPPPQHDVIEWDAPPSMDFAPLGALPNR